MEIFCSFTIFKKLFHKASICEIYFSISDKLYCHMTKFEEKHQLNTMKSCFFYSVKKLEQTLHLPGSYSWSPWWCFRYQPVWCGHRWVPAWGSGSSRSWSCRQLGCPSPRTRRASSRTTLWIINTIQLPKIRQYMYHFISIQVAKGIVSAEFRINFRESKGNSEMFWKKTKLKSEEIKTRRKIAKLGFVLHLCLSFY